MYLTSATSEPARGTLPFATQRRLDRRHGFPAPQRKQSLALGRREECPIVAHGVGTALLLLSARVGPKRNPPARAFAPIDTGLGFVEVAVAGAAARAE
jgi:hypothetical protein